MRAVWLRVCGEIVMLLCGGDTTSEHVLRLNSSRLDSSGPSFRMLGRKFWEVLDVALD